MDDPPEWTTADLRVEEDHPLALAALTVANPEEDQVARPPSPLVALFFALKPQIHRAARALTAGCPLPFLLCPTLPPRALSPSVVNLPLSLTFSCLAHFR